MAISKSLKVSIKDDIASLEKKLIVYENDKNIDLYFSITNLDYSVTREQRDMLLNIEGNCEIVIVNPVGLELTTRMAEIIDNTVKFTITEDLTDELTEIGKYQLQFRIIDTLGAELAIPSFSFEVKERLKGIKEVKEIAIVDSGKVGLSMVGEEAIVLSNGYVATNWQTGDVITATKLNKLETKVQELDTDILTKAPISHTHSEYAQSSHTHTGYSLTNHTHTGYAPTSHTHTKSNITDFTHRHDVSEIDGLGSGGEVDLTGYATETFVMDKLGGKRHIYLTQAEYDALSEAEKNDDTIVYAITDAEDKEVTDLKLTDSKLELINKDGNAIGNGITLPTTGGGSNVTVENNLTSTSATNALAAAQGKALDDKITVLNTKVDGLELGGSLVIRDVEDGEIFEIDTNIPIVNVTSVSLNKSTTSINIGESETLTSAVLPSNATDKSVVWSSSNNSIATVSASGVVSGIGVGSAVISATTTDGGFVASCSVTVSAISVTSVTLNKTTITMNPSTTDTLTATVLPANATNKNVTWATSNSSIATVANGVVTGVADGSCTITVTTVDGSKTATCSVTVQVASIPVTGITLDKSTHTFKVDETVQLNATISPSNATNNTVTWTSSDETKATVVNGLVTAKAEGSATITATTQDGSFNSACNLTVQAKESELPSDGRIVDGLYLSIDGSKGTGTDAILEDLTVNNYDAILTGFTYDWTSGASQKYNKNGWTGKSIQKYISSNKIEIPAIPSLSDFTIDIVVRVKTLGVNKCLFSIRNAGTGDGFTFISNSSSIMQLKRITASGSTSYDTTLLTNADEKLFYLTFTSEVVDASNTKYKIYSNGVEIFNVVDNYKAGWGAYPVTFGANPGTTNSTAINLYSFNIYNRVLSDEEIIHNYNYDNSIDRGDI